MTAWCCPSLVQLDLVFAAVLMLLGQFSQFLHAVLISSSNWRKSCTEYWNHLVLPICLELVGQNSLFASTFSGPRLNKLENLVVKTFGCTSSSSSACYSTSSSSSSSKLKNDLNNFFSVQVSLVDRDLIGSLATFLHSILFCLYFSSRNFGRKNIPSKL